MSKRNKFAAFILTIFSVSAFGQNTKPLRSREDTVHYLIQQIDDGGDVGDIATGFAGVPTKQFFRFLFLRDIIKNEELAALAKHSTGCLRVYAYLGLYYNHAKQLREVENLVYNDTTKVLIDSDVLEKMTVADFAKRIREGYWIQKIDKGYEWLKDSTFREKQFAWIQEPGG